MAEWQDISTAPKDGSSVLAWDGHTIVIAGWVEQILDGEDRGYWFADYDHGFGWSGNPVKWQPLPETPE